MFPSELRSLFWIAAATVAFHSATVAVAAAAAKTSKRGLAFSAPDTPGDLVNANQSHSQITWQYDWGQTAPDYLAVSNIEYIPMQWGSVNIEVFQDAVKRQGAKTILAFNEPDYDQESNMKPEDAAKLWIQYLEPLRASGVRLGGPAVTASGTGRPWLAAFFDACKNCTIDFLPLHWYGEGVEGFYNYLGDVHNQFPRIPLWVTEYASTSANDTEVWDFLNQTTIYMDSLEYIERYAWFGFFRPRDTARYNLLSDDGGLNKLGELYTGVKTIHTQVVTQAPTKSYQTVYGSDNPSQALVTTYPAVTFNASPRRWNVLGTDAGASLLSLYSFTVLVACATGFTMTLSMT